MAAPQMRCEIDDVKSCPFYANCFFVDNLWAGPFQEIHYVVVSWFGAKIRDLGRVGGVWSDSIRMASEFDPNSGATRPDRWATSVAE